MKKEEGRKLIEELIEHSDVLIENFRPGRMEKWGLGPDNFEKTNPKLVYTRISGFGQDGPYSSRPGFASVCEAMGGFRYVNGFPDRPPARPNLSIDDTIAGIHAALGIVIALLGSWNITPAVFFTFRNLPARPVLERSFEAAAILTTQPLDHLTQVLRAKQRLFDAQPVRSNSESHVFWILGRFGTDIYLQGPH
ncbi:hypothetical protein DVH05_013801 [Phytophthora capsici]|nr:hypothetical protein DVH05_013801 [Phytophthora capsici]